MKGLELPPAPFLPWSRPMVAARDFSASSTLSDE
jgi:hypothetical protein